MLELRAPGRVGPPQRHATIANAAQPTVQSRKALRAPKRYSVTEVSGSQERAVLGIGESTSAVDRPTTGPPSSSAGSQEPLSSSLAALPTSIRDLFLPPGYPASVTPDYLPYQLWSVPTHITGRSVCLGVQHDAGVRMHGAGVEQDWALWGGRRKSSEHVAHRDSVYHQNAARHACNAADVSCTLEPLSLHLLSTHRAIPNPRTLQHSTQRPYCFLMNSRPLSTRNHGACAHTPSS